MDRRGRNPKRPLSSTDRGGGVSKRGRGGRGRGRGRGRGGRGGSLGPSSTGRTTSVLGKIGSWVGLGTEEQQSIRSSSSSVNGRVGDLQRPASSMPSTSRSGCETDPELPQAKAGMLNLACSKSVTSAENAEALEAAKAHLLSISGVVTEPPIFNQPLTSKNLLRIKGDLTHLTKDPPTGIQVMQDDNDMTLIHAIITGPIGTPYEAGFFYFLVQCHANYPVEPPKVKFMTTGGREVRFNPNLYNDGTVCLSVLGTWSGPGWMPTQTLSSLLVQIQSAVLNDKPYHNEPGYEFERTHGDSALYNRVIEHETLRVAVIGMVNNDFKLNIPDPLMAQMSKLFLAMYDIYETKAISNLNLSGLKMETPKYHRVVEGRKFEYDVLLRRLRDLKKKLLPPAEALMPSPGSSKSPDTADDVGQNDK